MFQVQPKSWSKPGDVPTNAPEKPAAAHPSGDRDSDSEDEEQNNQPQTEQISTNTKTDSENTTDLENNMEPTEDSEESESISQDVPIPEDNASNMEVSENTARVVEDSEDTSANKMCETNEDEGTESTENIPTVHIKTETVSPESRRTSSTEAFENMEISENPASTPEESAEVIKCKTEKE